MYLYSNITGCYIFNQNFKVREKVDLKDFEMHVEIEKKFEKKFKNIKNLRQEPDKALDKIQVELRNYKKEFYDKNLLLTKKQIKDSVKDDLLIMQASNSIQELNKTINILVKRLREWYSFILPELENKITDQKHFTELVLIKRTDLVKEYKIKNSMGTDLNMDSIVSLAQTILTLFKEKEAKEKYLEQLMEKECPNLTQVAGSLIGAKLISIAGSLKNLAVMPSSTVQILGAEKALFRHMTTGAKPPRHGIIVNHPLISGQPQKEHGKRARALADKISLAVKVDFFKGKFIGDKLVKELEERFS